MSKYLQQHIKKLIEQIEEFKALLEEAQDELCLINRELKYFEDYRVNELKNIEEIIEEVGSMMVTMQEMVLYMEISQE